MDIKKASFAGHESFPMRHAWLTKGVTACSKDSGIFRSDDAMIQLGVGKNMVRSIRHWCISAGVAIDDERGQFGEGKGVHPTELGRQLFLIAR